MICPGDALGNVAQYEAGHGTYVFDDDQSIRSSIFGNVYIEKLINGKEKINVLVNAKSTVTPIEQYIIEVGDRVTGRIVKVSHNQAFVDLLIVGERELNIYMPPKGVIRREDVRKEQVDAVRIKDFFKPGQIIQASVISLGDSKYYFLSTAEIHK